LIPAHSGVKVSLSLLQLPETTADQQARAPRQLCVRLRAWPSKRAAADEPGPPDDGNEDCKAWERLRLRSEKVSVPSVLPWPKKGSHVIIIS